MLKASAAQVPHTINPPVLTPQSPVINPDNLSPAVSPSVEVEQTKEQPMSNDSNQSAPTQILNSINQQESSLTAGDQQIPYSSPGLPVNFPQQVTSLPNSSVPVSAFQTVNSQQYGHQQHTSTHETLKPYVLSPQVTTLYTTQLTESESTAVSTPEELTMPSVGSPQSVTTQASTYQSPVFPPQNNYSQYHPTNVGGTTTVADIPNSKEISNYFTQFQNQVAPSNSISTIPMFSVKNFPQMSPLAQPLGKFIFYFIINFTCYI